MDRLGNLLSESCGVRIISKSVNDRGAVTINTYPSDLEWNESFRIAISLTSNRIKLNLEWGKFSAETLRSLLFEDTQACQIFEEYGNYIMGKGGRIILKVNDFPSTLSKLFDIQGSVSNFDLNITSPPMGISHLGENELAEVVFKWANPVWGMMLSLLPTEDIDSETLSTDLGLPEGAKTTVVVNRYERNKKYRNLCLIINGYSCKICGFNFENSYGCVGREYIHVHHVVPVSKMTPDYNFNPAKDLIPICPNCHSMIHKEDPPMNIKELKSILSKQQVQGS